ncbi:MAG: hypothetical protein ACRDHS_12530 [Actinomycetota bacterium]
MHQARDGGIRRIEDTLAEVFAMAESEAISTEAAADRLVRRRRLAAGPS